MKFGRHHWPNMFYLSLFGPNTPFLSIFSLIYPYLTLSPYIYPLYTYLVIFALNFHDLTMCAMPQFTIKVDKTKS